MTEFDGHDGTLILDGSRCSSCKGTIVAEPVEAMDYKDFSKRLDTTVNEGGRKVEAEHYEWYANQGVVLKVKYRPRSVRRGGS